MVIDLACCVRFALALVLASAAVDKARALDGFAAVLARWIRGHHRRWARAVVAWEAALAATLCAGPTARIAAALAGLTFIGFALATAQRLRAGHAGEPCGCGGVLGEQRTGSALVVRTTVLAGAACAVAIAGRACAWPDAAPALALVTIGLVLVVALAREAIALRSPGASLEGDPS